MDNFEQDRARRQLGIHHFITLLNILQYTYIITRGTIYNININKKIKPIS